MGRIAGVRGFLRRLIDGVYIVEVSIGQGGGVDATVDHFDGAGDDAYPLSTDHTFLVENQRTGSYSAVGYMNPLQPGVAGPGERRIFGRDPATGLAVSEVWCKNTGEVLASNSNGSATLGSDGSFSGVNSNGSFELQAGGNFVVNGVTIDTAGNIASPTSISAPSIQADSKELAGHDHPAGTPPGNTGANN